MPDDGKLGGNDYFEVSATHGYPNKRPHLTIHSRILCDPRADMARELISRWGMIAGAPDGEDSAGRAKGRLLDVDEVVARACDAADCAFAAFKSRGWSIDIGSADEVLDAAVETN